jgi:transcriptional regulator with XRE-family HTH domain
MNRAQTLDSRPNTAKQTPAVALIHLECGLPLHRLDQVRRQEHVSRRTVARHLGITVPDVKRQECKTTDLPLSVLYQWAEVLGLPVAELVEEPGDSLSTPLFNRARLVRVMKTAMTILEQTGDPQTKRLAQIMVEQLMAIMPELRDVSAWHAVGRRRSLEELGIAAERSLSAKVFMDVVDCEGPDEP